MPLALGACGDDQPKADITDRDFDNASFSRPVEIDNKWLPLVPGTRPAWATSEPSQ